jgi:hypothetical protein
MRTYDTRHTPLFPPFERGDVFLGGDQVHSAPPPFSRSVPPSKGGTCSSVETKFTPPLRPSPSPSPLAKGGYRGVKLDYPTADHPPVSPLPKRGLMPQ